MKNDEKTEKRRIKTSDLAEYEKNAKDEFVDTRNMTNQLDSFYVASSAGDSLDGAKESFNKYSMKNLENKILMHSLCSIGLRKNIRSQLSVVSHYQGDITH